MLAAGGGQRDHYKPAARRWVACYWCRAARAGPRPTCAAAVRQGGRGREREGGREGGWDAESVWEGPRPMPESLAAARGGLRKARPGPQGGSAGAGPEGLRETWEGLGGREREGRKETEGGREGAGAARDSEPEAAVRAAGGPGRSVALAGAGLRLPSPSHSQAGRRRSGPATVTRSAAAPRHLQPPPRPPGSEARQRRWQPSLPTSLSRAGGGGQPE